MPFVERGTSIIFDPQELRWSRTDRTGKRVLHLGTVQIGSTRQGGWMDLLIVGLREGTFENTIVYWFTKWKRMNDQWILHEQIRIRQYEMDELVASVKMAEDLVTKGWAAHQKIEKKRGEEVDPTPIFITSPNAAPCLPRPIRSGRGLTLQHKRKDRNLALRSLPGRGTFHSDPEAR